MIRTLFAQHHNPPPPPPTPPFNQEFPPEPKNPDLRRFNPRWVRLDFPHFQCVNPAA